MGSSWVARFTLYLKLWIKINKKQYLLKSDLVSNKINYNQEQYVCMVEKWKKRVA